MGEAGEVKAGKEKLEESEKSHSSASQRAGMVGSVELAGESVWESRSIQLPEQDHEGELVKDAISVKLASDGLQTSIWWRTWHALGQ